MSADSKARRGADMARVGGGVVMVWCCAYLVWLGNKAHKGVAFVALGAMALTVYGVVAAFRRSHEFGRVLAAYGGVFIVGSLLSGVVFDGFRPERYDYTGAVICLVGVLMYAPR